MWLIQEAKHHLIKVENTREETENMKKSRYIQLEIHVKEFRCYFKGLESRGITESNLSGCSVLNG